ncbi:L,D-transpeptidase [Acrocarpospora sp. B8E8]|uniref:L,D-transpeptidase n=1 Tax=Acrocarpospora sp. B8E8 TaxID=3153572 RepID=UPI00325D72A3
MPVAVLPTHLLGNPTWVPVVDSYGDWVRVLLPSRPNRSTGWVHTGSGVDWGQTDYKIYVSLRLHRMSIHKGGRRIGTWPVATGAPNTPTPVGRTFVMASVDTGHGYGVPVLPLGTHSPTMSHFGGGPATIGLHGWPHGSGVFGHSVSNGCVRVPQSALPVMRRVPLGTVVTITR